MKKKQPKEKLRRAIHLVPVDNSLAAIAERTADVRRRRFILALNAVLGLLKPDDMDKIEDVLETVAGRELFQGLVKNSTEAAQ